MSEGIVAVKEGNIFDTVKLLLMSLAIAIIGIVYLLSKDEKWYLLLHTTIRPEVLNRHMVASWIHLYKIKIIKERMKYEEKYMDYRNTNFYGYTCN